MSKDLFPKGYLSCAKNVGVKKGGLDFTCVFSRKQAAGAAVFTRNTFCGCAVTIGRKQVEDGRLQAVAVISGNANVATGQKGHDAAMAIIRDLAGLLGCRENDVLFSSTGVIGVPLPLEKIRENIRDVPGLLKDGNLGRSAEAIMTTDKYPKIKSVKAGNAVITGIAKGAGMIEPNMATMLVYFFTDAEVASPDLDAALRKAVNRTFNMISIDSDTSTSDTVAIMANGLAGPVDAGVFETALTGLCKELALEIIRAGEGTTRIIEANVYECRDYGQANRFAKSIINSPLVKTAVYGNDPNWGRIAMALGKTFDPEVDPLKIRIAFGDTVVYDGGREINVRDDLIDYLKKAKVCVINVFMGLGQSAATAWGSDLTEEYVHINASYTT
ncbi:MAG: bifunctional glutamate N-acetyltransferase/amino-acid acetyltransferase ArgJ [Spirochaetales bacterium]|nr:bifunctional glutamate N-acetyltransferase/amino-acid acetyltransferase ArgJ [Spirochaetales bacterium]